MTTATTALVALALVVSACAPEVGNGTETSTPAPLVSLALGEDGLGDVLFGFPPDVVISDISALYGEPDLDSDWIVSGTNIYGSCPGEFMRAVGWGSLVTIFINDTDDPLNERFYTYSYGFDYSDNQGGVDPRGLRLTTAAGIGIGSSVAQLTDAYGASVTVDGDAVLDVWSFEIAGSALRGLVTGPADIDTVTLLEIVPGCA
jgi:hypothetical protein